MTISGNLLQILEQLSCIGNDFAVTGPELACVICPSLMVGELVISGK